MYLDAAGVTRAAAFEPDAVEVLLAAEDGLSEVDGEVKALVIALSRSVPLSLTAAAGAYGVTWLDIVAWDDGGTANGGVDHSVTSSVLAVVLPLMPTTKP